MVTSKVYVNNRGAGREEAFAELERFADYLSISRRDRLHIRLLSEEMLGMVSQIGGDFDAEFWAEYRNGTARLCLEAELGRMSAQKREELLKASTSGKNACAKGFMGKIKNVVELYWLGCKDSVAASAPSFEDASEWKLSDYKSAVEQQKDGESTAWDELEKSIAANIADEISVGVKGETVEFIITKKVSEE